MKEINSIVIIDDKDLEYTTLGKKRKDLYITLVRMLKCKWKEISQCAILFKKSEDNKTSENNNDIQFEFRSLENFESLEDYIKKFNKEKTLILLDVLLTDDNADETTKNEAIKTSSTLYSILKKENWNVLCYSTAVTNYIGKISDEIYDGIVEMDWYDVRSSAIEIIKHKENSND